MSQKKPIAKGLSSIRSNKVHGNFTKNGYYINEKEVYKK